MHHSVGSGGFEDLKVVQVSATEWRVSKRDLEEWDPNSFSGIICQCGEAFGVTRPGHFPEWHTYSTFDRALASLVNDLI
jgi:hypothetical protein